MNPAFFNAVRKPVFNGALTQGQVTGCEAIISEGLRRLTGRNQLAYILATSAWETARTMQPIYERGARSYFDKYEPGTTIGKVLGNTQPGDGYRFRGRGLSMLTGRRNYDKAGKKIGVDLVADPDKALVSENSVRIVFDGMEAGWFTGKKLSDFINDVDDADDQDLREFIAARRIVNGTDKAKEIGQLAIQFENALTVAGYPLKPIPAEPVKAPLEVTPATRTSNVPGWLIAAVVILIIIAIGWVVTH